MHRQLLSAATSAGATSAITWPGGGGSYVANNMGTSGSAALQMQVAGSTAWTAVRLADSTGVCAFTTGEVGHLGFGPIPAGWQLRNNSTVASSTGMNVWISQ